MSENENSVEMEVVELRDASGNTEEFVVLEELEFEGRNFCILAPLEQVEAAETDEEAAEIDIEIYEVVDLDGEEAFVPLEDADLADRLMASLDAREKE